MNWFLVVFFLVNGSWIEAEKLDKEGWSSTIQPSYKVCLNKMKEINNRFEDIAKYKKIELSIKFECKCLENINNLDIKNCKPRNWFQKKIFDRFFVN